MGETIDQGAKERELAVETTYQTGQFQAFLKLLSCHERKAIASSSTLLQCSLSSLCHLFTRAEFGRQPQHTLFPALELSPD